MFSQFFLDWNETIQANTEAFVGQNDTIKAVFDSYRAFFIPLDLLKIGNWERGNELNVNSKYVAVQNKIIFSITTADNFDDFSKTREIYYIDSISNFRPPLSMNDGKVLYLTPEYKKSLNYFLGVKIIESKEPYKMNRGLPLDEVEKRYNRIRPFIPILYGHWGGHWHIETHPLVYSIIFNKDLNLARFDFRVGYQGGEAILKKENNVWVIKRSEVTWIE
ncbi:hypothetical protein [Lunatimonas salinarum]|uniref:hypothetical protein n=1 Tax=Lunatimonas salinarum TaxID=1774590 RepID=UPI001AE0E5A8|nr:hypothetical protein [Lunatimonas salinarum]